MDFYNCPYVIVIPFRNGNEYDEDYGCDATGKYCQCCQCKLTPVECEQLFRNRKLWFGGKTMESECSICICPDCRKQDECEICNKCYICPGEHCKSECPYGGFESDN